jgi:7-carboxy-7-deazaguanine synthase
MIKTMTESKNILPADGSILPLMEAFYTIQGEGYHSGKAAYFIRLGGCDVGCHWCDVKESWDAQLHPPTAVADIIRDALAVPAKAVVVTGGEPAMYPLERLTGELKKNGVATFLETSGAYPITGTWDWICLSPKKTAAPLAECLAKADELKVIVHNNNDLEWGEKFAKQVRKDCKLFLQPEWSKAVQMMPVIVDYVMKHPEWNVSLQTHKYMHIP